MEQLTEWREGLANWSITFFQGLGSGLAELFGLAVRDPVSVAIWLGSIILVILILVIFLSVRSRRRRRKKRDEIEAESESGIEGLPNNDSRNPLSDTENLFDRRQ